MRGDFRWSARRCREGHRACLNRGQSKSHRTLRNPGARIAWPHFETGPAAGSGRPQGRDFILRALRAHAARPERGFDRDSARHPGAPPPRSAWLFRTMSVRLAPSPRQNRDAAATASAPPARTIHRGAATRSRAGGIASRPSRSASSSTPSRRPRRAGRVARRARPRGTEPASSGCRRKTQIPPTFSHTFRRDQMKKTALAPVAVLAVTAGPTIAFADDAPAPAAAAPRPTPARSPTTSAWSATTATAASRRRR